MDDKGRKEDDVRYIVRKLMRSAMSDDYSDDIADAILPVVVEDVNLCADQDEWNEDDVRLAVGRVFYGLLGLDVKLGVH